ncbi:MAG: anaerobic ribonucleoside-triphosphate reductase activating protein [Clostridia bacterium]|nr:anaerobic ribonucleoside-triphosphate reductase activating protein [Clostridia bacterium]
MADRYYFGFRYSGITKSTLINGRGLRVVLWVTGCEHACFGCQNKELQDDKEGIPFMKDDFNHLLAYVNKPYIDGVTLSGGDPFYTKHREGMLDLLKMLNEQMQPKKDIWCYTGYKYEDLLTDPVAREMLNYVSVLVDGRFSIFQRTKDVSEHRTIPYRGDSKQRIIDVPASLYNNAVITLYD